VKPILLITLLLTTGSSIPAQTVPPLGSAQSFAVLGAATVTSTGPTLITGNIGVSPGTAITGFPPGIVQGGELHAGDPTATAAQADAHTAYNDLLAESCGTNLSGLTLGTSPGAVTLPPGVYCFASSAQLAGTLTLSGNGVYIFQIGTTFTTATGATVLMANGALASSVFWQVGTSATLGTDTALVGSFIAAVSITVTAGTSSLGRVFALSGAVTLDTNTIVTPGNQQFVIESMNDEPSAGLSTSSAPGDPEQCSVAAPCSLPLEIFFDVANGLPAILGNPNALFATNSLDDPDEIPQIVITNPCTAATPTIFTIISILNEDNTYYNFFFSGITGNGVNPCLSSSSHPASGNYCLGPDNGDCRNQTESGPFTMYAFPDPSGEYFGTFESGGHHGTGNSGSDALSIQINPDFSVTSTLQISAGGLCAAQTTPLLLTSTDPDAINYANYGNGISGISLGDVVAVSVADDLGNVLSVFATDQEYFEGAVLPAGSLYVNGTVISGVCGTGVAFYDKPFSMKKARRLGWRHGRRRHRSYQRKYMPEFKQETRNSEQQKSTLDLIFPVLKW
jgi:hypothetical protein